MIISMLLRVLAQSSSLYGVDSFTLIKLPSEAYQLSFLIGPVTLFSTTKVTSSFQCTHQTILMIKSIIIIISHKPSCFIQLLQDSLVGGMKTCIIATIISPAHSNMEETLSTLNKGVQNSIFKNKL